MTKKYSDKYLLGKVKDFFIEFGRIPRFEELSCARSLYRRFGAWKNVIELAGLEYVPFSRKKEIKPKKVKPTSGELLELIRTFFKENNRLPKSYEIPYGAICRKFGSWKEALKLANLDFAYSGVQHRVSNVSDEEYLDRIRRFVSKYGYVPKCSEFKNHSPIIIRFGSWANALTMAGFDASNIKKKPLKYSKEDLLQIIRQFYLKHKRIPRSWEISQKSTITRYFGSWANAVTLALQDLRKIDKGE